MGTLNIVGEDLQLRSGVGHRVVGQQQVVIRLAAGDLLAIFRHKHLTGEHTTGLVVEDSLVQFVAVGVGRRVTDKGVMVHVLRVAPHVQPVHANFGTRLV